MEEKQSELLQRIGHVSKSFAENDGVVSSRKVVFRAIHEIVEDMGKFTPPTSDAYGTVECLFRGVCRQIMLNPCDCKDYGMEHCALLQEDRQQALAAITSP